MPLHRRHLIIGLGSVGLELALVGSPWRAEAAANGTLRIHGPGVTNELVLDDDSLSALGAEDLITRTPWTQGVAKFEGLSLARALEEARVSGHSLRAIALNDYAVEIPIRDAIAKGAFLARTMDGRKLTVRDKGPFWLIFPWSARPELETASVKALSVWQLRELEIF